MQKGEEKEEKHKEREGSAMDESIRKEEWDWCIAESCPCFLADSLVLHVWIMCNGLQTNSGIWNLVAGKFGGLAKDDGREQTVRRGGRSKYREKAIN